MDSIKTIARDLAAGNIDREAFWRAMQLRHFALREHQALLADSTVVAIELTAAELRITTRDGVRLVWHPEDLRTAPNVLVNTGIYEPEESALLASAAADATVIFDVGANVGYYSCHWGRLVAGRGVVHAFEPVPATYARLTRNLELNALGDTVKSNNLGLGDAAATVTIFVPGFSGSGAASIRNLHPDEESVEVRATIDTLDAYFARAGLSGLDLMKVDVEGNELAVITGGMTTIAAHTPLLFMELLRKWSKPFGYHPNDIVEKLTAIGYRCLTVADGALVPVARIDEATVQTNFFFAHARHAAWLHANGAR